VDSAQGHADLRVERTGEPVWFGVRPGGPGAQNLDKQQIEDAGDHHRRSLGGRLHLDKEHPAGHFEPFERRAAAAAEDDRGGQAREQVARLRVADREGPAEPAGRLACVALGCAGARRRMGMLPGVADVVRITARKQDDIAVTCEFDVRVAVDPKHDLALIDEVQGADTGEAGRERPQRTVCDDPFSTQTDAAEQLREQVARLTIRVQAERRVLGRRMIGKFPGDRSKPADGIGRSARFSGGAGIVAIHSSDYAR
jgi:hypothetical protein